MDETAIISELTRLGTVGALFGMAIWLGYRLADRALTHLFEIQRLQAQTHEHVAQALLEQTRASTAQTIAGTQQIEEVRILLRRLLIAAEGRNGEDI